MRKYAVLVPETFVLVDLESEVAGRVADIARRLMIGLTTEQRAAVKSPLIANLTKSFLGLAQDGAFAVLFSVTPLAQSALRPTVLFTRFRPESEGDPLDAVVALAASEATAKLLEYDPMVGLRIDKTVDVSTPAGELDVKLPADVAQLLAANPDAAPHVAQAEAARMARRVQYFLGEPDDPDSWIRIQASVQVPNDVLGGAFADTYTELFDLVARSFAWGPSHE